MNVISQDPEAKYRQLYSSMMDGLVLVDLDGRLIEFNEIFQAMLGYERDELLALTYNVFTPERWHAYEREIIEKQVLARGYSEVYEKEYQRKEGTVFPVELRVILVKDDAGLPVNMWAIVRDISARKHAEAAHADSQTLLSALVESTNDLIWSVDPHHFGLLMFNDALKKYFLHELHLEIGIGMRPEDMLPPDFASKWHALYRRALREGSFTEEYRVSSGRHVLLLKINPLQRNGAIIGLSVFGKDITERVHVEEALGKRAQFEQLLADLSSRFTNMPAEQVDHEIESGLHEIRELLQVDRAALIEISENRTQRTHVSLQESIPMLYPINSDISPYYPWLYNRILREGKPICINSREDIPPEAAVDRESYRQADIQAAICIPISIGGMITHLIHVSCKDNRAWPEEYIPRLVLIGEVFVNALARKRADEKHKRDFQEINELKDRLQVEAEYLRSEVEVSQGQGEIVGQSQAINQVLRQIEQVGPMDSHVLITGETGTGKELVARAIHGSSKRNDRLMVTVNCATLPPTLIESELFGREKGAYTGALTRQIGRFELADHGTIFLDEIGELPLDLQGKLLRVLQEGTFERLGGAAKTIRVDVRIIAATNKDLGAAVREGAYRKDLYYRLSVFPIVVPPLRARVEDIPVLTWSFIDEFNKKMGKKIDSVPQKTMDLLKSYSWPGNVRELKNVIERAMITSSGNRLDVHLLREPEIDESAILTLEEAERRHIKSALQKTGWRIKGPQGAAALLAINPSTLSSRMIKLGIPSRPQRDEMSY